MDTTDLDKIAAKMYETANDSRTPWARAQTKTRKRYLAGAADLLALLPTSTAAAAAQPPVNAQPATTPLRQLPPGTLVSIPAVVREHTQAGNTHLGLEGVGGQKGWTVLSHTRAIVIHYQPPLGGLV
jgi:hypothetical protein